MPEQRPIIGNIAPYLRVLREHAIFGELPEQALKDLVIRSDLIAFAPAELILRQGDDSDSAWLITQGEADVFVDGAHGPVELGQSSIGALIGEIGVFADLPRTASVRARTAVEALRIARHDILHIGGDNPAFLRAVMKQLGERIAGFNQAIVYYTNALARLDRQDFDTGALESQTQSVPELVYFSHAFRRMAERMGWRRSKPPK